MLRYWPLILKNALRNRRRSILTVLSVAASFCLLGVLMSMYNIFFLNAPTATQALRLITRNRISITNSMPASYEQRIRGVPGVRDVTVFQYFGGSYKDSRDMKNYFARFAVEPDKFFIVSPHYLIPEDQKQAFQRDRTACIIGNAIAERLHLHVGDRITLVGDIFPVTLEFTLRGIYDNLADDGALLFNYEYLRESLKLRSGRQLDQVGLYLMIADSAESVPRVIEAVDEMFENSPSETKTETERAFALGFLSYLGDVKLMLISVCGALTFTVLLVSANTMAMSVRERVREVGILKTLGYTPEAVLGILLSESVFIALVGGLLGLGIAGVITSALRHVPVMFISLRRLSLPFWVLAATVMLSMLVGVASSFVPAWNASRRPIVACLRFTD
ncbi:MAG TPA: FtsX-like permease family protein [Verrucomicrobiae bacterium]|nr:FtsX-like permease family protein [Verrucomicrobiae bacterium]